MSGRGDTISREMAIGVVGRRCGMCIQDILDIPAAEPEKRTEKRTETHACDCIDRQAAIDHFRLIIDATNTNNRYKTGFVDGLEVCISHLSTMPSTQPEIEERKEESAQNVLKDDSVSRKAAIEALMGLPTWWADEGGYYGGAQPPMEALLDPEDAVSAIENLPPVEPGPQWIPCSERLPEDKTAYYLATIANHGLFFTTTLNNNVECVRWDYDRRKGQDSWHWCTERTVIAWMPLPEPYREEGEK